MKLLTTLVVTALLSFSYQDKSDKKPVDDKKALEKSMKKAAEHLAKQQQKEGHFGKNHPIAITAISGLAFIAYDKDPFKSEFTDNIMNAYKYLISKQKDGDFEKNGHTWIHGQGFATLFLAEFYGKVLLAKDKPKVDEKELKGTLEKAVKLIEKHQSKSGGWYYDKDPGDNHEGSTTVCAVQALRAAANYGIKIDDKMLESGFEYLKKCQLKDGGFVYHLGNDTSMKPGSAGALSTLVLMKKLDENVLMNGLDYLNKVKAEGIWESSFPHYGMFYAAMAMKIVYDEYGKYQEDAGKWQPEIKKILLKEQQENGSWKNKGWTVGNKESDDYATSLSLLTLAAPNGNLSIFHRDPPKLPKK